MLVRFELLVLGFQLPNTLLLRGQRFAYAGATGGRFAELLQSTPHGAVVQIQILADLRNRQALFSDHLHYLEFERGSHTPAFAALLLVCHACLGLRGYRPLLSCPI